MIHNCLPYETICDPMQWPKVYVELGLYNGIGPHTLALVECGLIVLSQCKGLR